MTKQLTRDTVPEVAIRKRLHARGLRYRVHYVIDPQIRCRADIAFTRRRVVIFVDGCFWHSCPEHATRPKANAEWWAEKLLRNVVRDRETDARLTDAGWRVVRIWEHEDPVLAVDRIVRILEDPYSSSVLD